MMRWEYTTLRLPADNDVLNGLGSVGWELVGIVNDLGIFKRRIDKHGRWKPL